MSIKEVVKDQAERLLEENVYVRRTYWTLFNAYYVVKIGVRARLLELRDVFK